MRMTTIAAPRNGEIDISGFAKRYEEDIATRSRLLPLPPGLLVLSDHPYDPAAPVGELSPIERYLRALETTADRTGVNAEVIANLSHIAIEAALDEAGIDPAIRGVLVTVPFSIDDPGVRKRLTERALERVPKGKDVDGLRPGGMPATSEASIALLESVTGGQRLLTNVNGGKGHVGSGIVRLLESGGYEVTVTDKDTPSRLRRELFSKAAVLISATGQAEGVTRDDFEGSSDDKKYLINVGRGRNTAGKTVGDFASDTIDMAEVMGWSYTNNGIGVGRVATLRVMDRTVG